MDKIVCLIGNKTAMAFPNALNAFVAQAKKDIAEYEAENPYVRGYDTVDNYNDTMMATLFNSSSPEVVSGGRRYDCQNKRDCFQLIDNDAESLWEIIEWVSLKQSDDFGDSLDLSKGIPDIFAKAWYFVGHEVLNGYGHSDSESESDSDSEPTMSEIKALVSELA